MSERFQVAGYGSHAYEVQDIVTGRHVCVVGLPELTAARNRHAGEDAAPPREETLELARAVAAALNRVAEEWPVSGEDAGEPEPSSVSASVDLTEGAG